MNEESEKEYPERYLWRGVIGAVIQDFRCGKPKQAREAKAWIRSEDLQICCDLADLDVKEVKKAALEAITIRFERRGIKRNTPEMENAIKYFMR